MIKKFTTFLLAFAIVLSVSTPKSSAAGGAIGTVVGSFAKYTFGAVTTELVLRAAQNGLETYFSKPQTKAFAENLIAEGIFSLADYIAAGFTDQDLYDQLTNYNAELYSSVGTTSVADGAFRLYFPFTNWTVNNSYSYANFFNSYEVSPVGSASFRLIGYSDYVFTSPVFILFSGISVPFDCYVTTGYSLGLTGFTFDTASSPTENQFYTTGSSLGNKNVTLRFANPNGYCSIDAVYYADITPTDTVNQVPIDVTAPSRPTSLVTPIAIQNADETYTVYNNITLVDEGNKVVFDPTTGESITFTDWAYDYESRTYDLTLDGGGNMTVQFGNDSITMTQGDTVTNIFYGLDPADDPGTDNPDDPDNPGTDADVSGFFAWWKNAWNGFVDRLFTVLDGGDLEVILPGEEGNPEDEEDDGWTVFDLFALIRDALWKIITGVITVVLDGFLGLVDAIASLGDFFDIYDPANPDGIFGIPGGGVELWS